MVSTARRIEKPQRWDTPFGPQMSEADVNDVLGTAMFRDIDADRFPRRLPLRGILLNDTRIVRFENGDIVVRRGDYGHSAFLILSGAVHIDIGPGTGNIPDSLLGRKETRRKSVFGAIAQLWRNSKWPEARQLSSQRTDHGVAPGSTADLNVRRTADGDVQVFLQDVPQVLEHYPDTIRLEAGEIFGEIAALGRTPRTATVFAEGRATLLEIRWQGLRELRKYAPGLKKVIDERYRQSSLEIHLRETEIFDHLDQAHLDKVKAATRFETYGDFDWYGSYKQLVDKDPAERLRSEPVIAQEGHYPNGIRLIRSGFVRVSKRFGDGHLTQRYLGRGQIHGFEEIAHNWRTDEGSPLQTTLRAVGYADALFVPTAIMEQYVLPTLPEHLLPPPLRVDTTQSPTPQEIESEIGISSATLEFLVEKRIINGTASMIINLDRCTRCDDCVRACAATHDNNPRFLRSGPQFGHYMVTNACMHCRDPVCLIGCPTGAISRNPDKGEVTINDETCIGCATCYKNCPYDAIRMVQIRDGSGRAVLDDQTHAPIRKATKCDLCADQIGGPACQRACPHDALIRADMADIDVLSNWFNR